MRRLDTYNTVPVQHLLPADIEAARGASVAAFASPSALKSWVALVGGQDTADVAVACIGACAVHKHRIHQAGVQAEAPCSGDCVSLLATSVPSELCRGQRRTCLLPDCVLHDLIRSALGLLNSKF